MAALGKITAVTPQKRNKNRVSIHLDGAYYQSVSIEAWAKSGLRLGQDLTEEDWRELMELHEARRAMDYAMYLLGVRMVSKSELEGKLAAKGYDGQLCADVVEKCVGYGYVDDAQLAQAMVAEATLGQKMSRRTLMQRMQKRGLDKDTISDALEGFDPEAEHEAIKTQYERLLLRYERETDDKKRREKIIASLMRKGFSWDDISRVMKGEEEWSAYDS